jgi:hypothetical protein
MKLKYRVAVKFYTETKNQEQLNLAYKEIESFTENYKHFKYYYKFDFSQQKDKINLDELDLDGDIEAALMKSNSDFVLFLDRFKYKQADIVFQQGNYNVDLVKWAIEKVQIKEHKTKKEEIDISSLLDTDKTSSKYFSCEGVSWTFSIFLWLALVVFSIALIFTHCYMYMKNPLKFFKGING